MDYLLDEDIEMELLSAIAFEDDVLTQQEQLIEHMDDTTIIPDSLPSNNKEAAISSTDTANCSTEVAVSPNEAGRNRLLSLLELKLPPLRFDAATPTLVPDNTEDWIVKQSHKFQGNHKAIFSLAMKNQPLQVNL